jgi:hypothetical protein
MLELAKAKGLSVPIHDTEFMSTELRPGTLLRTGELLSFAFVATSPEQLTVLTESLKTVQFF